MENSAFRIKSAIQFLEVMGFSVVAQSLFLANQAYAEQGVTRQVQFLDFLPLILVITVFLFLRHRKKSKESKQEAQVESNALPAKKASSFYARFISPQSTTDKIVLAFLVAIIVVGFNEGGSKSKAVDSTPKKSFREQIFEIKAGDSLKAHGYFEGCKRESERIAKCILVANGGATAMNSINGRRLSATASKWATNELVSLPDAIVNAPEFVRKAEITILMPEGTDFVVVRYDL